ncbi:hypothetical protein E3J84_03115 [Candidatus Aerophobetes bacterium]|uniref:Uncharacterized protein n=1 Tax=Aerophobetes bacterium TaxID=2030807 RepID=A0A523RZR5_UNCAE|nr:MAG: hypothetical protein E3J84_03115 [Candidatus Aerophobetes bacterium]
MAKISPKVDYDEFGDVLYVTFGTGELSYCEEIDDFLLLELGIFSNLPTGFRLVGFKEKIRDTGIKNIRLEIEARIEAYIRRQREPKRIRKEISEREKTVRKAFEELKEEQLIKA